MPHSVTMRRAISVARLKSFEAPVVSCSGVRALSRDAARPKSTAMLFELGSRGCKL